MIEANENIDLVTLRRQMALEAAQREAQEALSHAYDETAASPTVQDVQTEGDLSDAQTLQPQTESPDAPLENAAFRQTRLAITVGLVVVLLALWIYQRRTLRR